MLDYAFLINSKYYFWFETILILMNILFNFLGRLELSVIIGQFGILCRQAYRKVCKQASMKASKYAS